VPSEARGGGGISIGDVGCSGIGGIVIGNIGDVGCSAIGGIVIGNIGDVGCSAGSQSNQAPPLATLVGTRLRLGAHRNRGAS
jgi:hypothetical protein